MDGWRRLEAARAQGFRTTVATNAFPGRELVIAYQRMFAFYHLPCNTRVTCMAREKVLRYETSGDASVGGRLRSREVLCQQGNGEWASWERVLTEPPPLARYRRGWQAGRR